MKRSRRRVEDELGKLERIVDAEDVLEAHLRGIEEQYLEVALQYAQMHGATLKAEYVNSWAMYNGYISTYHNQDGQLEILLRYPVLRGTRDLAVFFHELGHMFDEQWLTFVPSAMNLKTREVESWTILSEFRGFTRADSPRDILCQEIAATRYAYQQMVKVGIDPTEPMKYLRHAYETYVKTYGGIVEAQKEPVPLFGYVYQMTATERI